MNGHLETGDPNNPYTETVQRGMRRLFTLLTATAIGNQTYPAPIGPVNPDSNGNGLGIYTAGKLHLRRRDLHGRHRGQRHP